MSEAATAPLRIVLADDHVVVREGIKALVNAQGDMGVVGEASDGEAALGVVRELRPDVLVVDMSMPGLNGAQVTRRVRQECPGVRVLALTVHDDREYLAQLLKAGATGYVLKRAASSELIQAIRVVAAGGLYLDPMVAGKVVDHFVGNTLDVSNAEEEVLSQRETEVLKLVARGFSNKEVASRLSISVKTVETHKARIMEKLRLQGRSDMVRFALKRGWLTDA